MEWKRVEPIETENALRICLPFITQIWGRKVFNVVKQDVEMVLAIVLVLYTSLDSRDFQSYCKGSSRDNYLKIFLQNLPASRIYDTSL
jgi:hypothetical protein